MERHEAIRTTFSLVGEQPVQVIQDEQSFSLHLIDLSVLNKDERESKALQIASEDALLPLDLNSRPLVASEGVATGFTRTYLAPGHAPHHL